MKFSVAAVIFLTVLVAVSNAAVRTWTSANGKYSVKAELVSVEDECVCLKKEDGAEISVPLEKLSDVDQRYVRLRASRKSRSKAESRDESEGESDDESDDKKEARGKAESSRRRTSRSRAKPVGEVTVSGEAQTLSMKLARLEIPRATGRGDALSLVYRATRPQHFYMPVGGGARSSEFSQVVEKEPKYASTNPCRGVAHLGSQSYGFALDSKGSGVPGYGRLYFDMNQNGDLTDDRYVEAEPMLGEAGASTAAQYRFPRVDLVIDVDGTKTDYAFLFSAVHYKSKTDEYVSGSLNAAAYREAEIRGQGKSKHRLVLVDYNSNGRFDDEFRVEPRGMESAFAVPGDLLLVDPDPAATLDFDLTAGDNRYFIAKLVNLGGTFFELKVSPSGDQVELNPASVEVGYVSSQHPGFRALLYSDQGVLKIGGEKSKGIPLPVGEWKLLSYSVDLGGGPMPMGRGGRTLVAARATSDCKSLEIVEGKTVDLPFGPPFKPVVHASGRRGNEVRLALSIVGAGGEVCTNLLVNGSRPPSPEFIIATSKGEVVERGTFKYG